MAQPGNWFIGLPVPEPPGLERILAGCPPELRRFHPADLHITVAFLGPVGAERAGQAWRGLGDLADGPFTVTLGALRPFGRPGRPSAFGFELDRGGEAVAALIRHQRDRLRLAAGVPPERRLPRPHVTLARPGRRATAAVRLAALRWAGGAAPPEQALRLDRIALYRWSEDRLLRLFAVAAQRALPSSGDAA